MKLLPTPDVTLTDAEVEDALRHAVAVINPLLYVLWRTDPFDLKRRTPPNAVSWALNAADFPGTLAWDDLSTDDKISWWVWRVGALNTIVVAFPGVLGVLARRLPIQDLLGFASQAIVLCAVARELGVTDYRRQVRLLAWVLCGRDLSVVVHDGHPPVSIPLTPLGIAKALWNLAGVLDAIGDELAKRPHPRAPFRYVAMLPAVGVVAAYLGECGALSRAAKAGQQWIETQKPPQGGGPARAGDGNRTRVASLED
ncbi:hypothetical protein MSAR_46720 [Mycolicibacterium sarraceniae]|uniref:Uncharacterized protein n=1 Tax=Mycolicibacterium sarraceniae TaxID=1534348 RepID=A0A7I7T0E8_9MYCO|nr:hypothetical protein MSAR_46720 [Mycolicibacterium sarraceniae]